MSGDEHNFRMIAPSDLALKIQPVDVRQFHVENQASRQVGLRIRHLHRSGAERDRLHVEAQKKLGQRFADATIVVHDEDNVVLLVQGLPQLYLSLRYQPPAHCASWQSYCGVDQYHYVIKARYVCNLGYDSRKIAGTSGHSARVGVGHSRLHVRRRR